MNKAWYINYIKIVSYNAKYIYVQYLMFFMRWITDNITTNFLKMYLNVRAWQGRDNGHKIIPESF